MKYQNIILLILILIMLPCNVFSNNRTKFSSTLGLNIATVEGSDTYDEIEHILLGAAGLQYNVMLYEGLSFQVEMLISQKGFSVNGENISGGAIYNYIDVIFSGKLDVSKKIYILMGSYIGIFIKGKSWTERGSNYRSWEVERDDVNGADFGLLIGSGLSFYRYFIEGRYNFGIKNFLDEDYDVKNRIFQIIIGYSM